jgi:hypothetical protein
VPIWSNKSRKSQRDSVLTGLPNLFDFVHACLESNMKFGRKVGYNCLEISEQLLEIGVQFPGIPDATSH